jgi:hypothetical protein
MNPSHLHLMLNHVPVVGVPLVAALLAWAMFRGSRELYRTAMGAAVIVAALTYPVFLTGEPAEERVEDSAWASRNLIHQHEERAEMALTAVLVTGALAAFGLWQSRGGREAPRLLAGLTLAGLAVGSVLLAWTALAGGPIRHDEIRPATASAAPAGERGDSD